MKKNARYPLVVVAILAATFAALGGGIALAEETKPAKPVFKEEELAAIFAPIALYPDNIVAQMLMASTYPLEIVTANRWVQKNSKLKGEALAAEAKKQPWAESVQAMTAFPDILKQMDEKLEWTQKMGDAYLAQPKDVMAMIQVLRNKAKEAGNLKSDDKMKVSVEAPAAGAPAAGTTTAAAASTTTVVTPPPQTIIIQSADPQVVYVPSYNPTVIYGSWYYPAYPPYYFPPPYGYGYASFGAGFFWGAAIGVGIAHWGGSWGCSPGWHGGDINIDIDRNFQGGDRTNINSGNRGNSATTKGSGKFSHDPSHRQGVGYRDSGTASKYNRGGAGASTRDAGAGRGGASAGTRDMGAGGGSRDFGGASAGTRDAGAGSRDFGGASAGTRDAGGGSRDFGGTSAGTRDAGGSSSRGGYSSSGGSSSRGSAFSGSSSGRSASSYSSRGGSSRGGGGRGGGGRR